MMSRVDDMRCTGSRHSMMCNYKVGYNDDGSITAFEWEVFVNGKEKKIRITSIFL